MLISGWRFEHTSRVGRQEIFGIVLPEQIHSIHKFLWDKATMHILVTNDDGVYAPGLKASG
jgi:hypothetical protein